MRVFLLFFVIVGWVAFPDQQAIAQNRTVSGQVVNSEGQPLEGVTVSRKIASSQAITNNEGRYQIAIPLSDTVLVFSAIGYETLELAIPSSNKLNVTLIPSEQNLDEVVVVGYGTQSRRTVTSAITKIGGEQLQDIPISTEGEGLKGKVSGARVYQSNSTPGADAVFRIRGGSAVNKSHDTEVLVVGVERAFSGVNPNDVESIEVLKDAASTAIYGSRASTGVVLITTKKGSSSQAPRITFDANVALQEAESLIDFMNARDYINTVRPAV